MTDSQQFLIYQSEDGSTRIDVMLEAETLWLNQKQLTELFGKAKGTISEHIKHIFEDEELTSDATVRLYRTVQTEGGREVARDVEYYNLDMVLALGFRVRSPVGVRFRQWANDKLKEYIVKSFVLDDARLKNPGKGQDYFDELTRRLQDIRTSESGRVGKLYLPTRERGHSLRPLPTLRNLIADDCKQKHGLTPFQTRLAIKSATLSSAPR